MKLLRIKYIAVYIILLTLILKYSSACRKFVQVPAPPTELTTVQAFGDDKTATSSVAGIYIVMMGSLTPYFANGGITLYTGLSADELYPTRTTISDDLQFYNNAVSATTNNTNTNNLWANAYTSIYYINASIEGLTASTGLTPSTKSQLLGEVKFLRAFFYFNMVNLYGPVPLVTTIDFSTNGTLARTSTDSIYAQIESDLQASQSLLSAAYPSTGRVRPNQYTAMALLSRVYLYDQKWDSADVYATKVINSGLYSLNHSLPNVFDQTSNEAIWELFPVVTRIGALEPYLFIPSHPTSVPNYPISPFLLNSFEPGDQRRSAWIDSNTISGVTYNYPYKYNTRTYAAGVIPTEYYTVLRLSELYLIRSEARLNETAANLSGAITDLDSVRNRAGLPNTTAADPTTLSAAILHERQTELFCEWGHRWFDLKRTGTINTVLGAEKTGWQSTSAVFPIPFTQIQANPFLVQNPGY